MKPSARRRSLLALAALFLAGTAWAEAMFSVNEAGTGIFDQPSVVADGTTLHLAFVGDNAATGRYKVYYAAVNGAADFTNKATTRSQVLLTPQAAIDNGSLYSDARHPQIARYSSGEMTILFQALPSDNAAAGFKLFRARVALDNHVVVSQQVAEIVDNTSSRIPGSLVDPSFGVVATDNTLRIAYTDNTTGDVYYARVRLDNASLVGAPIPLTRPILTRGATPLPRLRVEGTTRSHIAWAANSPTSALSDIYYAMVKEVSPGVDNLAIGASPVLTGSLRWGFPNVLLPATNRVLVLAADEPLGAPRGVAGLLGVSLLNPEAVVQDGNPVNVGNVGTNGSLLLFPPGNTPLSSTFSSYHPEASLDPANRVHVAGYGFLPGPGLLGTAGSYFSMSVSGVTTAATANLADLVSPRVPVGNDNLAFAASLADDYTRPAFVHFSTKAVLFWSGQDNTTPGARNLYVTSALSSTDPPVPSKQSGCAMIDSPGNGETERIPGAAALFLPAALIALRRGARKIFVR